MLLIGLTRLTGILAVACVAWPVCSPTRIRVLRCRVAVVVHSLAAVGFGWVDCVGVVGWWVVVVGWLVGGWVGGLVVPVSAKV